MSDQPGVGFGVNTSTPEGFRQHRFTAPPGSTTILLVRHGESAPAIPDQPFELRDGHGDPPLDPVGVAQAELVAQRLVNERVDAIYVTTLRRTHDRKHEWFLRELLRSDGLVESKSMSRRD